MLHSRNIDSALSPWPERWCVYGTGTSRFVGSHCNVIEVPKMLVKWMLYNDSAWVYYVRAARTRDVNWTPVKPLCPDEARVFDLSGRLVGIQRALRGYGVSSRSPAGRMPPGYYVKVAGNAKEGVVQVKTER
jgi:hypothetical protein